MPSPNIFGRNTMGDEEHLPDIDDDDFIAEIQSRRHDVADSDPWSQLRDEN